MLPDVIAAICVLGSIVEMGVHWFCPTGGDDDWLNGPRQVAWILFLRLVKGRFGANEVVKIVLVDIAYRDFHLIRT